MQIFKNTYPSDETNITCVQSSKTDEKFTMYSFHRELEAICEPKTKSRYGYDQQQRAKARVSRTEIGDTSAGVIFSNGDVATRVAFTCSFGV